MDETVTCCRRRRSCFLFLKEMIEKVALANPWLTTLFLVLSFGYLLKEHDDDEVVDLIFRNIFLPLMN